MAVKLTADTSELKKYIASYEGNAEKVINATLSDFRKRAPGWVAAEVVKEYNIKKNEIVHTKNTKRSAGRVGINSGTIDTAAIIYMGRPLTPLHFSVTPKQSRGFSKGKTLVNAENLEIAGGRNPVAAYARIPRSYSVTMQVKKGHKETLKGKYDTPPFMAPVRKGSSTMIPFQRKPDSNELVAFRSLSLPQMIENNEVSEGISKAISENLGKRLDHHVARFLG